MVFSLIGVGCLNSKQTDIKATKEPLTYQTEVHYIDNKDELFIRQILNGIQSINTDISIVKFPEEYTEFPDSNDTIRGYAVLNNTKESVTIQPLMDDFAYIFDLESNNWVKVNAEVTLLGEPKIKELLPFNNDWFNAGLIISNLDLLKVQDADFIRLLVIAEKTVDGKIEQIAAWLDVPWNEGE